MLIELTHEQKKDFKKYVIIAHRLPMCRNLRILDDMILTNILLNNNGKR